MDPLFPLSPDFTTASVEELRAFIVEAQEIAVAVAADHGSYISEERSPEQLLEEMTAGVAGIEAARAELATREPELAEEAEADLAEDPAVEGELADQFAALAARVAEDEEPEPEEPETEEPEETASIAAVPEATPEPEPVEEPEPEPEPAIAAAAPPSRTRPSLPRPARSRAAEPAETRLPVALTAAADGLGYALGTELPDGIAVADMMVRRRGQFGNIPDGVRGEKVPIARMDWRDEYPDDRTFMGGDIVANQALIAAATNPAKIKAELRRRREKALTASGGLCAPVTPYYNLQMIAMADRPVRAALPSFNADRGGIRFGRPVGLSHITTGVGVKTADEDAAGGSEAVKTCQIVDCPPFDEVDVEIIYHCLQFGNLSARTFPERVAEFNNLVLAAHARVAESEILTGIDAASTQVTAASLGFGATGDLLGQVLAAANGLRNRNRMDAEAVLRIMLPDWAIDLMVSDVIRSQFQRFETDEEKLTALLRSFDVEPTFYIDSASGKGQIFGDQTDGALLPFPATVTWYLYPEGSFLYVDGGVLELGLVRDSVLNKTNDFQIFGESFENVAFVGVESLAVTSTTCDSGVVAAPAQPGCGDYS